MKDRRSDSLTRYIDEFKVSYNKVKRKYPFKTLSYVVLPEHADWLWQLPSGDSNYSIRWREIKKSFTLLQLKKGVLLVGNKHGENNLWQRRYWEHTIRDVKDFGNHVDYIHYNPVKHGLVGRVQDWPYSSFLHFVNQGMYTMDWAGGEVLKLDSGYGE